MESHPVSSEPLRDPTFLAFWTSRTLSTIAFQMLSVGVGWHIYDVTHSAFALGMVGLVQFLPQVVLTLIAGHAADRYDRRGLGAICQGIEALTTVALVLASVLAPRNVTIIYTALALIGAARAFEGPTLQALLPALVPIEFLANASARSASATQVATIIGPALGGLTYGFGMPVVFGICSALFFTSAMLLRSLRVARRQADTSSPTLTSLLAGLRYIHERPVIFGAITLDLFAVLLGGATALLPIYARDILHTSPWGLGLLRSAPALGALIISLMLGRNVLRRRAGAIMFACVAAFGVATIIFALSHSFILSLVALIALGATDVVSVVIRLTLVQLRTPDAMRGRVNAVNWLFIGTSNQLGEFESGITAGWWGAVPAALVGGIGTLVVTALWMRFFPQLLAVDSLDHEHEERT